MVPYLAINKEEAKAKISQNVGYKHIIQIGNQTFQLLQNGLKGYAYILHNDSYEIKIGNIGQQAKTFSLYS
jgi:hypothetical protein